MIKVGGYIRQDGVISKIEELEMPTEHSYGYAYHRDKVNKNCRYFVEFDIQENGELINSQGNKVTYSDKWTDLIESGDFVNDRLITDIVTISDHNMNKLEKCFVYHTQGYLTDYFKESEINRLVTKEYYQGGLFIDEFDRK